MEKTGSQRRLCRGAVLLLPTSSPTVATSAMMTVFAIAAHQNRGVAVVDIGGALQKATINTGSSWI